LIQAIKPLVPERPVRAQHSPGPPARNGRADRRVRRVSEFTMGDLPLVAPGGGPWA